MLDIKKKIVKEVIKRPKLRKLAMNVAKQRVKKKIKNIFNKNY